MRLSGVSTEDEMLDFVKRCDKEKYELKTSGETAGNAVDLVAAQGR